ncbi:MAG: DNA polymerase III subunit delta [Paracoccaceae bacterium]|nr:MAG: DNA polymerase III subunit delta [Paracoccaceae bacterium]
MNLKGAAAARYCAAPDPAHAGLLLSGADPMRVALKRQEAVAAIVGPSGEAEMRLTRIAAAELRRDPALLSDGLRAQGFFPGRRAVLVEDAGDGLADVVGAALADWRPGDAQMVVTAGALTPKSALKAVFEGRRDCVFIALWDDPPGREEIEAELARAGLRTIAPAALAELEVLARALEPGDFRQTLEKIALYKLGDATPLTPDEIAALAPATVEAEVDEVIRAAAEGQAGAVGPLMRRLEGQGVAPVTICIGALRYFRMLHAAAADAGGAAQAIARMRGVPFKARDAMVAQAGRWGARRLEAALSVLIETDLTLRSASRAPGHALVERALLRLAMTAGGRG